MSWTMPRASVRRLGSSGHITILLYCCYGPVHVLALMTPLQPALSCRVRGFFPFPGGPRGPVAWLFRDTHQALSVKCADSDCRLHMDFMTEGGQAHPVWWDEGVKWRVLLGGSICGEVRIRSGGRAVLPDAGERGAPSSKLERLREIAESYDTRMNLYTNNCRIFCARMRREAERLNVEDLDAKDAKDRLRAADLRLAVALLRASTLPMLYPGGVLFVCWEGLRNL